MAKIAPKKMQALVAKRKTPAFPPKKGAAAPPVDDDMDDDDDDEEDEGGATDHPEPDGDEVDADAEPMAAEDDGGAGGDEGDDQAIVDEAEDAMATGDRDEQLEALMDGFEPDGPPPPWAQDKDVWDRAVLATDPDGGAHDEPWLLVAHVYKAMGGQVNPGNQPSNDGDGGGDVDDGEADDLAEGLG